MSSNEEKFLKQFEKYCDSENKSGKGNSYAKAILYLCDFLCCDICDKTTPALILENEENIKNKKSLFYKDFLDFLKRRNQSSYLASGFVRAALRYYFDFINIF